MVLEPAEARKQIEEVVKNRSRFADELALVLMAVLVFAFWPTAGVIALDVLGLTSIAISRRGPQGG